MALKILLYMAYETNRPRRRVPKHDILRTDKKQGSEAVRAYITITCFWEMSKKK